MKTNKFLMAVALPAFLAACTAEEIEQVSMQDQAMNDRALLSSDFAINVADIESRFAWENAVWKYETGDQFGAAITDVANQWTVSDGSMFGNYIFTKNEAGNYVTDSQMGEGVYMLYSYDGFKTKMARSLVEFDLTNQICDLDDPTAEINKYKNQLMFTPLYKLQEKYSTEPMAPTFYSYYGVGAFKFKNNSGQDLKITQIILKHTEGNMVVKGRISQAAFADAAQFVYNEDKEDYVLSGVHAALKNKDLTTAQKNAAIEDAEEAFEETIYKAKAAVAADASKGEKESSFITLNCQNYLLAEGEETTAYMFVPAGYEGFEVEIMVVDEEGETWSVYANAEGKDKDSNSKTEGIKVTGMDKLELQRHKGNMIFGKSSDGKTMKTLNIKEENLSENSGYYVDSKAAMLELLDANLGDIKVHNSGDWAIDAEIVEAIIDYTGANIEFSNPITIKSAKALTNNDEWELALSGVEFDDVTVIGTIKEGETVLFEGTTVELDNITVNGTLTIEEGANVTIKNGSVSRAAAGMYGKIKNYGALAVEMDSRVSGNGINNYGALTIAGAEQYVDMFAGSIEYVTGVEDDENVPYTIKSSTLVYYSKDYNVNVKVGEDVTFKLDNDFTIDKDDNSTAKYSLENNGVIDLNGYTLTVNGALDNNNEIKNGSVVVAGSLTNDKTLDATVEVKAGATLNNNGEAKAVTNNGNVVTGEGSKTTVTAGEGRINNTNKAQVTANADQTVFFVVTDKAVEDLESILFKRYAINTLRVAGTLTLDRPFDDTKNYEQLKNLKTLELTDDAEIKVDGKVVVGVSKVVVEGDAKISGWSKAESSLTFGQNVEVLLTKKCATEANAEGYVLTLADVKVAGTEIEFKAVDHSGNHVATTGYYDIKPEIKLVDAVMIGDEYGTDVEVEGYVIEVTASTTATAVQNGDLFLSALSEAKDGETIVLGKGDYSVETISTGVLNIDKNVKIVGESGTKLINDYNQKGKTRVLQLYCNNASEIYIENVELVSKNNLPSNLWIRTVDGNAATAVSNVVLKNVKCSEAIIDNGYVDGFTINVDLVNCKIDDFAVDAWSKTNGNALTTYSNLTYDSTSEVNARFGSGYKGNVTINGINPK